MFAGKYKALCAIGEVQRTGPGVNMALTTAFTMYLMTSCSVS